MQIRPGHFVYLIVFWVISSSAWAAVPAEPLAAWNFDEGQAETARDSSGHGHDGRVVGAQWSPHQKGFALSLDGVDDYVECTESRAIGIGGPLSVAMWIKPTRKAHGEAKLLGEGYATYVLTYYNGENVYWYIGGGGNNVRGKLVLDEWNHVVATFDGTQMNLWINGLLAGSRESKFKAYQPGGRFSMGAKGAPQSPHFKGMLDQVRVYGYAMTKPQVVAQFQAEKGDYLDLTWFGRVRIDDYRYPHRDEVLVEADYRKMQPLQGPGRLEVTLSHAQTPDEVIERQVIDPVSKVGVAEATLSTRQLAAGTYVVRVQLKDEHGTYPVEQLSFTHPQEPRPLVAPTDQTVPQLPAAYTPAPYDFQIGRGGGFTLTIAGARYPFESRISWPHGQFNRLTADDRSHGGEPTWTARILARDRSRYKIEAGGQFYTIHRDIEVHPTHVHVKDRYTNTSGQDLGLLIYNETPVKPGQVKRSWLSGYERRGRQAELSYPHYSLSVFFTDARTGLGIVPVDDVYVVQAAPYVDWQGAAGVGTEKFALGPGQSYTLEWAIYPTVSGDYYDFVNTFRQVEGRISTVDGAFGFITRNPRSRRQVPTADFITKQGLKYGIIHCLSFPPDDPQVSIEGIEFMDFPQEMDLLKKQAAITHRRHPGFKVMFHIAHSLYCTNQPDRFADSKVITADGTQPVWGATEPYISKQRQAEGWTWWIFYPTPGNSFHDAMMKSADVVMDEIGMDGVFMDGFFAGYRGLWTYDRWDNHSAAINLHTKTITRKLGSVLLLSQPSMIEFSRKVRDKGGAVVGMHTVFTRSIANEKYIVFSDEATGPGLHLAPNITALGSGKTEKGVYLKTLEMLSWGCLFVPNNVPRSIGHDLTHPLLSSKQFPITFEEIRSGLVKGKERIVTMNSGVHGWQGDRRLHAIHKFDGRGAPVPNDFLTTVVPSEVRSQLEFDVNQSAVIEPIPVTLETSMPVNARVLQYDDAALHVLLHGRGQVVLDVFVGHRYFPGRHGYRVTLGGETTTINEEEGTLSIPLELDGLTEVRVDMQ